MPNSIDGPAYENHFSRLLIISYKLLDLYGPVQHDTWHVYEFRVHSKLVNTGLLCDISLLFIHLH